jgi:hypothetical protein
MARYNEILVGRFNRFAQKYFSMKGPASLAVLNAELAIHHQVQNGEENRYLEGWDLFGLKINVAAPGVGNLAEVEIRNPAGSNVIAVLTRITISDPTAGGSATGATNVQLIRNAVNDQNIVTAAIGWDLRGRPASTCIVSNNSAAATAIGGTAVNIWAGTGVANLAQEAILASAVEVPLTPGVAVLVTAAATNTTLNVSYWWRERFLEDSERS